MLQYIKPYRHYAAMTIVFMVGEVLIDLYQPRMMETIVNEGVLGLHHGGVPDLSLVMQTGIWMALIVAIGGICGVMGGVCVNFCAQNFGNDIRKDCFQRIMHLSMEQIDAFRTGSLITRITSDTTQVQTMVSAALRGVVRSLTFLIAGTAALLTLDIHFSMIAALAVPVILIEVAVVVWRSSPLFCSCSRRSMGSTTPCRRTSREHASSRDTGRRRARMSASARPMKTSRRRSCASSCSSPACCRSSTSS